MLARLDKNIKIMCKYFYSKPKRVKLWLTEATLKSMLCLGILGFQLLLSSINISIQENTDLYQLVCSKGMLSRTVSSVEKGRRELHG